MKTTTSKFRVEEEGEDRLIFVQDENNTLRQKCLDLEDAYSALRARCFSLEAMSGRNNHAQHYPDEHNACACTSTCTRAYSASGPNPTFRSSTGNRRAAKENQDLISSLFLRNDMLQRDYSGLRNRHQKVLSNNGKLKKEVHSLRLRTCGNSRPKTSIFPTSSSFAARSSTCNTNDEERQSSQATSDAHGLVRALEARLDQAEKHSCSKSDMYDTKSHESIVKELADATSKLHSMKDKCSQLESTCNLSLDKLERTKAKLRATKREKERAEEEVAELRRENASLEEKITSLCEVPFTSTCDSQETDGVKLDQSPSKEKNGAEANKSLAELDLELDEYADDFEDSI